MQEYGQASSSRPWHYSLNLLRDEVERIANDLLTQRMIGRSFSTVPSTGTVYHLAMSYLAHMERNADIIVDDMTRQLVKDLVKAKWESLAEDFSGWMREMELASHVGQMTMNEELHEAQRRALDLLSGHRFL